MNETIQKENSFTNPRASVKQEKTAGTLFKVRGTSNAILGVPLGYTPQAHTCSGSRCPAKAASVWFSLGNDLGPLLLQLQPLFQDGFGHSTPQGWPPAQACFSPSQPTKATRCKQST